MGKVFNDQCDTIINYQYKMQMYFYISCKNSGQGDKELYETLFMSYPEGVVDGVSFKSYFLFTLNQKAN